MFGWRKKEKKRKDSSTFQYFGFFFGGTNNLHYNEHETRCVVVITILNYGHVPGLGHRLGLIIKHAWVPLGFRASFFTF